MMEGMTLLHNFVFHGSEFIIAQFLWLVLCFVSLFSLLILCCKVGKIGGKNGPNQHSKWKVHTLWRV